MLFNRARVLALMTGCMFFLAPVRVFSQDAFIGEVRYLASNYCPIGWVPATGYLLPISQHVALFSLLGTNYGGDGVTTFAVPDLRGRFPLGAGQGVGLSARNVGDQVGAESVTVTQAQMPLHNHYLMAVNGPGNTNRVSTTTLARPKGDDPDGTDPKINSYSTGNPSVPMNPNSVSFAGSGQPISIMPPAVTLTACICSDGIWPVRP